MAGHPTAATVSGNTRSSHGLTTAERADRALIDRDRYRIYEIRQHEQSRLAALKNNLQSEEAMLENAKSGGPSASNRSNGSSGSGNSAKTSGNNSHANANIKADKAMIERDRYRIYQIRQRDEAKVDRYQANLKSEQAMLNNARSGGPGTSNQAGNGSTGIGSTGGNTGNGSTGDTGANGNGPTGSGSSGTAGNGQSSHGLTTAERAARALIDRDRYRIYEIRQHEHSQLAALQANLKKDKTMLDNARSGGPSASNLSNGSSGSGNGNSANGHRNSSHANANIQADKARVERDRDRIHQLRQREETRIDGYQANLKTEQAMLNNARSGGPSTSSQSGNGSASANGTMTGASGSSG